MHDTLERLEQREQREQRERQVQPESDHVSERLGPDALPEERTLAESLLYYTGIIWRYRWLVFVITLLAALGVLAFAIVSLRLPPEESPLPNVYEADAVLLQQRSGTTQSVSATIMASLGLEANGSGLDYGQIALAVLNSREFVDRIVEQNDIIARHEIEEKVRTESRNVILSNSTFGFDSRTGMLEIAYRDIDPELAAQVVDSIVTELLSWFAARGGSDRLLAVQTLEDKLAEVEARIREIEGEIEQFQRRYGVLRVEEIAQTQTDLVSGLQSQLLALDLQISNQEEVSRIENDPELLSLRSQRQNVLNLMERIRDGYAGSNELLPPRDQLPGLAADYSRLQMDLEIQGRIFQALTEQYEVARLTADTDPAFSILVPVEVPEEKSGPSRVQLVTGVTAGGFFGSIVLALLIHGIRNVMRDPDKRRLLTEAQR
jgi:capsule polysaccharide export protein KpsE/RkpR